MRNTRRLDFSILRIKFMFLIINWTLYAPLARTQIWSFVLKNPCLRSKFRHFIRHSCGPDFPVSPIEIHVFGQKLDTLSATRVDLNLGFLILKSVFKVKK